MRNIISVLKTATKVNKFLFSGIVLLVMIHCTQEKDKSNLPNNKQEIKITDSVDNKQSDSLALLKLTKQLYEWQEFKSKESDFDPLQKEKTDTIYAGIDMIKHKKRLKELQETQFFSKSFIDNYNKIAVKIDKEMKTGNLQWVIGELPTFGNDTNFWCNCQDVPDNFLNKIWIMNLNITDNTAAYNWSWGEGLVYHIKAVKENNSWKIAGMEGFDYENLIGTFQNQHSFSGKWQNGLVTLNVGDDSLAFEYHGQCVYFYPVKKISDTEFEMIWARDMDCKFDNGTDKTFGLKNAPQIGKPFAKFSVKDNRLNVVYYYKDWVEKYTEKVQDEVFTESYVKKID